MKKYFGLFIFITACTSSKSVEPGLEIKIAEQNTYEFNIASENSSIKVSKIEDSRCPEDVVCIWAGEAVVTFDFKINQKTFSNQQLCLQCDPKSGIPEEIILENQNIKLVAVSPYPNAQNSQSDKIATFKVN